MNEITVSALWYTLIKGTGGIWKTSVGESVEVDERGIKNDRRWLVVDETGMFVAQRKGTVSLPIVGKVGLPSSFGAGVEIVSMCQIAARIHGSEMNIVAPGMRVFQLPLERAVSPIVTVQVWSNASLTAVDEGVEVSKWLSEFLSRERPGEYRLVRMTRDCRRPSKHGGAIMGFHDSNPFMLISDSSLGSLNGKLLAKGECGVLADRFRPNIWLRGCSAHAEDFLNRIRIGGVELQGRTLCDRCSVTCTDQTTAARGREPLRTLATYRRGEHLAALPGYEDGEALGIAGKKAGSVFFGKNFEHLTSGILTVGDTVHVQG